MRNAIKQTCILFLALSLTLILADSGFIDIAFSNTHISSHRECSDVSNPFDHSQAGSFVDDYITADSNVKSIQFPGSIEILPDLTFNIENCYILNIWQPPKLS
jgi:hypothetical protein